MGYFRVPLIHSYNTLHHLNPTILIPKTTVIHSQPKSQLEKPFPDTQKPEFQNEIPLSDTMKVKSQIEMSFYTERRSFLKKISYFRTGRKSARELTNYLLTPKM